MDFLSPAKWGVQVPYQLKMVCVPSYGELFPFSSFLLAFTLLCLYFITFFYRFNYIYTFYTFFEENNFSVSFSDIPSHFFIQK